VAGRHRKNPHHRGRHRKPPSTAQRLFPAGAAVAILATGAVFVTQGGLSDGHASTPRLHAPLGRLIQPPPSVLGFHSTRPSSPGPRAAVKPRTVTHDAGRSYSLRIADTGPACYVQVTNRHGRLLVRRILQGHQHLAFRHHGLRVVLGNAGGVKVAINGRHLRRAGDAGQVRTFRVK
jgi:hypothetical protein